MDKFRREYGGRSLVTICGAFIIVLTVSIGLFLFIKGSGTFTKYHHSVFEFLFSSDFNPMDAPGQYGGTVGAAVPIVGSLLTCGLALLIATPFSIAAAVFITEIAPVAGKKVFQPAIEIFVGIPSVVYGWIGLSLLVPWIKNAFHLKAGFSVLGAGIVYGLGSTRWQMIWHVVLPASLSGILTGIIMGLSRAFGEALAVAMVIGKTRAFPKNIFSPTINLTAAIAADMTGSTDGGEFNLALWSMALLLFIISILFIVLIHVIDAKSKKKLAG